MSYQKHLSGRLPCLHHQRQLHNTLSLSVQLLNCPLHGVYISVLYLYDRPLLEHEVQGRQY